MAKFVQKLCIDGNQPLALNEQDVCWHIHIGCMSLLVCIKPQNLSIARGEGAALQKEGW